MPRKLFGYAPWAFVRLAIADYPIPIWPENVFFITLYIGSMHKTWPLLEEQKKGFGWFLYKRLYNSVNACTDYVNWWATRPYPLIKLEGA